MSFLSKLSILTALIIAAMTTALVAKPQTPQLEALKSLDTLVATFNQDHGRPRVVLLLSPT